jgi:hypothetical protein
VTIFVGVIKRKHVAETAAFGQLVQVFPASNL